MTPRKPPNVSIPNWVERQIRTADAEGAFANLPGAGQPIRGLGTPQPELSWLADYLRRENADLAAVLPPALAIAKEVEDLPARLLREPTEARVRAVVDELNARIDVQYARPQVGPPFRVKLVKVDAALEQWRADRAAVAAAAVSARPVEPPTVRPGRRWRRRGARRSSDQAPR
jgi:hypothetical protein